MTARKEFPADAEEARIDRDVTREELAETLTALGHKLDLKSRAAERVDATINQATDKVADVLSAPAAEKFRHGAAAVRSNPLPVFAGALALVVLIRFLVRRKHA
jgi:hypothetical protein